MLKLLEMTHNYFTALENGEGEKAENLVSEIDTYAKTLPRKTVDTVIWLYGEDPKQYH